MAKPEDPLLGRTLDGRYQLHEKLGEGGMGAVYRATHTLMGKPCAIKVLRGPTAVQELAGKRFQREAQSASRLDHEHCIRVSDFGRTPDGISYLVMELLEGRSLAEELGTLGALPLARVVSIARQVAEALEHAHGLGVVHRDLKPDNIMLCERGGAPGDFVKVLDFGLAKIVEQGRSGPGGSLSTLSEVGSVFGTPEYMSPEQAEGRPLDARADLYSFGVLLYQMLTGQLPFQAASFIAVLTKHMTETPVSPALRRPDLPLPAAIVELCLRCLSKDPAHRPQSASEVIAALDAVEVKPRVSVKVAAHPTVELSQVGAVEVPEAPRRRWLWAVLALPILAAIVIAAVALRSSPPPPQPAPAPVAAAAPVPAPSPAAVAARAPDAAPVIDTAPAADPEPAVVVASAVAPAPRPRDPGAADHLREAARYRKAGNRIKELFHLQQAVKADPQSRDALYRLGAVLLEDGQHTLGCDKLGRAGNIAKPLYERSGCGAR